MFQKMKGKVASLFAALAVLFTLSPAAFAGGGGSSVDVSAVVSEIGSAVGPIGAIGAAVLLVLVAVKIYKWVRRAM